MSSGKTRILTGDTPTGRLHLGHYVGSVENRLALQADPQYDCYFLIANKHAFTTRADRPDDIRASVLEIATDYLACGIDPDQSTIFIQSEVPAIDELTFFFSMLIPFNRVMRNPTLKDEIRDKELGDNYPFGFPLYAVGQCADILAFRPQMVPVKRLVGLGAPSAETGQLLKMSKSLNNAIFLSDPAEVVQKKIMGMYTDPKRLTGKEPGEIDPEKNPLWAFHETFNGDTAWVEEHRALYAAGKIGDVAIKRKLIEVINALIDPIRTRRKHYEDRPDDVIDALRKGTARANAVAEETLALAKKAMRQDYFARELTVR
jgi:tryptophanyl-tRNA synthetase